jgi:hypothetical protein
VRPTRHRTRSALVAAVLGLSAGGCGSESGVPADSPQVRVRDTIHAALTVRDPKVCTALFTHAFVNQTNLGRGSAALQECRRDVRRGKPARDTQISRVAVAGAVARARVALLGGDEDGATYDLRLVRRGGSWKLDRITHAKLDFERYLRAGRRQITRPPDALPAKEADCVLGRLRKLGEARLERSIVTGSSKIAGDAVVPCMSAATLRRQLDAGIRRGLNGRVDSRCVLARLHRTVSEDDLRAVVVAEIAGGPPPQRITRAIGQAVIACAQSAAGRLQSS